VLFFFASTNVYPEKVGDFFWLNHQKSWVLKGFGARLFTQWSLKALFLFLTQPVGAKETRCKRPSCEYCRPVEGTTWA